MVSMSPDSFWALTESLLADGYHPTENIIVTKKSSKDLTVKEGNRRIAALKIILRKEKGSEKKRGRESLLNASSARGWAVFQIAF